MSQEEQKALETLAQVLPIMTEAQRARIIGYAEGVADKAAENKEKEATDEKDEQ